MTTLLAMWPGSEVLAERAGQCYTLSMEFVLHAERVAIAEADPRYSMAAAIERFRKGGVRA